MAEEEEEEEEERRGFVQRKRMRWTLSATARTPHRETRSADKQSSGITRCSRSLLLW
jgi:hypothetical protein